MFKSIEFYFVPCRLLSNLSGLILVVHQFAPIGGGVVGLQGNKANIYIFKDIYFIYLYVYVLICMYVYMYACICVCMTGNVYIHCSKNKGNTKITHPRSE